MKRRLLLFAFIASYSVVLFPQETDSVNYPTFKVDGVMKNKFEYASEISTTRFTVRSSRIGVGGKIAQSVSLPGTIGTERQRQFQSSRLVWNLGAVLGIQFLVRTGEHSPLQLIHNQSRSHDVCQSSISR